jgi:hypothetical protein
MTIRRLQLIVAIAAAFCAGTACADQARPAANPEVFAPGVISGPASDDAPVFTPDGRTVWIARHAAQKAAQAQ